MVNGSVVLNEDELLPNGLRKLLQDCANLLGRDNDDEEQELALLAEMNTDNSLHVIRLLTGKKADPR